MDGIWIIVIIVLVLIIRDKNKTLLDEEVNKVMEGIVSELEKDVGAELRK